MTSQLCRWTALPACEEHPCAGTAWAFERSSPHRHSPPHSKPWGAHPAASAQPPPSRAPSWAPAYRAGNQCPTVSTTARSETRNWFLRWHAVQEGNGIELMPLPVRLEALSLNKSELLTALNVITCLHSPTSQSCLYTRLQSYSEIFRGSSEAVSTLFLQQWWLTKSCQETCQSHLQPRD